MNSKSFDIRKWIADQPVDEDLIRYKDTLYPNQTSQFPDLYGKVYTYVLDWHEGKYSYLSDALVTLMGYGRDILDSGIEGFFNVLHPDDTEPLQKVIQKWMEVLLDKKPEEFNSYTANFNYRLRLNSGSYINLLQQPIHVSFDKKSNLVYEAGILIDITRYRNDGNLSLLILDSNQRPIVEYYPKEDFAPQIAETRQLLNKIEYTTALSSDSRLRSVQKVILKNLHNDELDVNYICRELSVSRSNLYKTLKSSCHTSPAELIRSMRLLKSLSHLASNELNISEIAYKVGFQSHSHFTQVFQKKFDCTPSAYRSGVQ
jgi:AraC-like DNA-binding protein